MKLCKYFSPVSSSLEHQLRVSVWFSWQLQRRLADRLGMCWRWRPGHRCKTCRFAGGGGARREALLMRWDRAQQLQNSVYEMGKWYWRGKERRRTWHWPKQRGGDGDNSNKSSCWGWRLFSKANMVYRDSRHFSLCLFRGKRVGGLTGGLIEPDNSRRSNIQPIFSVLLFCVRRVFLLSSLHRPTYWSSNTK